MANENRPSNPKASAALQTVNATIAALLAEIAARAPMESRAVDWGDVGSATHVANQLAELVRFLGGK